MAARLNNRHQDMIREKIRAAQLVKVLEEHVLEGRDLGKSQVTAALGLLKKCVADLSNVELSGDPDNPVRTTSRIELVDLVSGSDSTPPKT